VVSILLYNLVGLIENYILSKFGQSQRKAR
jgi:hypothetical protein